MRSRKARARSPSCWLALGPAVFARGHLDEYGKMKVALHGRKRAVAPGNCPLTLLPYLCIKEEEDVRTQRR